MATKCVYCGNRAAHEKIKSIGGTWHRCSRCNYAWRGLGPALAALFTRARLDESARAEVVERDHQPLSRLSELARAARPAPPPRNVPGIPTVQQSAAPSTSRFSSGTTNGGGHAGFRLVLADESAQEVVDRDHEPLSTLPELAAAARPAPPPRNVSGGPTGQRSAPPSTNRLSSSDAQLAGQESSQDGHWLAGVEAHFAGQRDVTDAPPPASQRRATVPDPGVASERQLARPPKAEAHGVDRPAVTSVDPTGDHWLAGVEATFESRPVTKEGRGPDAALPATGLGATLDYHRPPGKSGPAPVESSAASVGSSDLDDVSTRSDTRQDVDHWFEHVEDAFPLQRPDPEVRRLVEREPGDVEADRRHAHQSDEPEAAELGDDQPTPAVPLAGCLAQLGAIHVDLERFGDTLARSDAAFSRIVSRWHAGGPAGLEEGVDCEYEIAYCGLTRWYRLP